MNQTCKDRLLPLINEGNAELLHQGFNDTGIPGLSLVMRTEAGEKRSFQEPYAALVLQGRKRTMAGNFEFIYGPGDCVITCVALPSVTYIEEASSVTPFLSIVLRLDPKLLSELALSQPAACSSAFPAEAPAVVSRCPDAIIESFTRLLALRREPQACRDLLAPILTRELYARLLLSEQGPWLRSVCSFGTRSQQVAAAADVIRQSFREAITIESLAQKTGMSPATLHRHFKALTGFSPIQYQRILRLYEARRLLCTGRQTISCIAFAVGYASASQFTHDYRVFFGNAPRDNVKKIV